MKIIREPSIYVLGRQTVSDAELNRFLTDHGISWQSDSEIAAEVLVETSGRTCYLSFASPRPGGNKAYLDHIKEVGHTSVLEHAVWNLLITGVSRSLTHELVRHRVGVSPSQLSQRYVDESVAEYVEPAIIAEDPELHAIWLEAIERTHEAYVKLADKLAAKISRDLIKCDKCDGEGTWWDYHKRLDYKCSSCEGGLRPRLSSTERRKAARQAARSVLPNATETKIFVTMNARAARHFLELRGSRHAEPEIRLLANRLLDIFQQESPSLFGDYKRIPLPDGTFEIDTPYKKV